MNREKLTAVLLWLWLGIAFGAYLFQYRDMAGPLLKLLGLI